MAVKSVVTVDVQDAKFKAFMTSFEKYKKALKALPADWQKTTGATDENREAVEKITDELDKQLNKLNDIERQKTKAHEREKARLDALRQRMKKYLDAIREQTQRMISGVQSGLSAIFNVPGMVMGGLAGAAGLWGLDRLAKGVTDVRRQAGGLGVSVGALKSARTAYGRFLDPESTLGNIAEAQASPQNRGAFARLGIGYQNKTADQLLPEIVEKAWTLWKSTKDHTDVRLAASGLGQFMSMADWRNIGGMDRATIGEARTGFLAQRGAQDLTPGEVKVWSDLDKSLEDAKNTIDKVLVAGLAPLVPDMKRLSVAFGEALQKILKVAKDNGWMDKLAKGLESMADTITKPEFINGLATFAKDIPLVVEGLVNALRILHLIPDTAGAASADVHPDAAIDARRNARGDANIGSASTGQKADALRYFMSQGWTKAQAAGIVANLDAESGISANPIGWNDGGKAFGAGQWHADRQAQFKNVFGKDIRKSSLAEQLAFVQWELTHTFKKVGDQLKQASSAATAGQLVSSRYEIPAGGSKEAQNRGAAANKIVIQVNNNTGGNANIMAPQTAAGAAR